MSTLIQFTPRVRAKFSGAGDPDNNIVGAKVGDVYRNTTSYELFTCQVATIPQSWVGSQGNFPITSSNHPNLVAFWTMDEISGATLIDSSANNIDGTISGPIAVPGKIGNALSFTGDALASTDRVSLSGLGDSSSSWAISCWASHNALGLMGSGVGGSYLFDQFSPRIIIDLEPNEALTPQYRVWDGSVWRASGVSSVSATLRHLVFSYSASSLGIYVNNVLVATLPHTFGGLGNSATSIGARYDALADNWSSANGLIDQFRVFNRGLTSDEIAELYNSGLGA